MREWIVSYGVFLLVGSVGLGIVGYGVYLAVVPDPPVVEIVKSSGESQSELGEIFVDVAGAVEKPGVYKLEIGSRIGDALVMAGGISERADREWVAKTLNLGSEIKDGGKIYIPVKSAGLQVGEADFQSVGELEEKIAGVQTILININTASVSELDSLWGIGEARAKAIVENRPYGSIEEVTSKAGIPQNVYEVIKEQVTIY